MINFAVTALAALALNLAATSQPASQPLAASEPTTTSQPTSRPADMLTGPIDPYIPGQEQVLFVQASGPDNQLTADEFTADQPRAKAFARKFDKWPALRGQNRDGNGTVDWFEADAYRKAFREAVIAAFDRNKDRRLLGPERDAANEALAAGKFPTSQPAEEPGPGRQRRGNRRGGGEPQAGQAPAADAPAGQAEGATSQPGQPQGNQRMMQRFDTDGDGQLSDEERQAMQQRRRGQGERWEQGRQEWNLRLFDEDGDGQLVEGEQQQAGEFNGRVEELMRKFRERSMDIDGDGQISEEERDATRQQWRRAGLQMMARSVRHMDSDGDGQVSIEEREAFGERMRVGMTRWIGDFTASYDANGDGRYDAAERESILGGINEQLERRHQAHDTDGDGRLSAEETMNLMEDFARETGAIGQAQAPAEGE